MNDTVSIIKIVVASPGDVQGERDLVGEVAAELNRGVAVDRGLRLEVVRWETDTYPGFHPEGPQGLIDPMLRIEDSDILIGIFWKRFGTPTKGVQSGTEYEIRKAIAAWEKTQERPHIMVYFNQKSATPQSAEEATQWAHVLQFRDDFPKEGLWWSYEGAYDFEKQVRGHLVNFIRQRYALSGFVPEAGPGTAAIDADGITPERGNGGEGSVDVDYSSLVERVAADVQKQILRSIEHLVRQAVTTIPEGPADWIDELVIQADKLSDEERFAEAEATLTTILVPDPDNVEAFRKRGLVRMRLQRYQDAIEDFSEAIERGGDDATLFVLRAYSRLGSEDEDYDGAEADFEHVIDEGVTRAYKGRAAARYLQSNFSGAEADLTRAIEEEPDEIQLYHLRALIRHLEDDTAGALEDLTRAIDLGQSDFSGFYMRGCMHYIAGHWGPAEADFSRVLQVNERSAGAYLFRGWLRKKRDDLAGAEADFSDAIDHWEDDPWISILQKLAQASDGDDPDALTAGLLENQGALQQVIPGLADDVDIPTVDFLRKWMAISFGRISSIESITAFKQGKAIPFVLRGLIRIDRGRFTEAEADFDQAIALGAERGVSYYGLGIAKLRQNKLGEAETDLTTALVSGYDDVLAHYWRGRLRLALEYYEGAEADFTHAMERGQDDSQVYRLRGMARSRQGRLGEAEADLSAALTRSPDDGESYFMRGAVRYDLERFAEAEDDLDAALEKGFQKPNLYALRGWSRFRQKDFSHAVVDFDFAVEQGHQEASVYYGRAAAHFSLGRYPEAESDYTVAIEKGLNKAEIHLERGAARLELGQYTDAEADAEAALNEGMEDGRAHNLRGWARNGQNKAADALDDFEEAIARGATDAIVYWGRGVVLLQVGRYAEAVSDFTTAINAGLEVAELYSDRGWSRFRLGQFAEAEADLDHAVAQGLNTSVVFYRRGRTRYEQDDHASAADDFQAAVEQGTDPEIFVGAGAFLFILGRHAAAEAALSAAIDHGFDDADTYAMRGQARVALCDYVGAETDLTAAIVGGQHDIDLYVFRGFAHFMQGDYEGAVQDCTEAVTRQADNALAYQVRVRARIRLHQLKDAHRDGEEARRIVPGTALTHYCWGDLNLAFGEQDQAVVEYEASLNLEADAEGYFGLGLAYLLAGRFDESSGAYDKGLQEAHPSSIAFALRELDFWMVFAEKRITKEIETKSGLIRGKLEQAMPQNNTG